jgi:hypothetical protein
MYALLILAMWIGSAVAGWLAYWPWLAVPIIFISLHIARVMAQLRAARARIGMPPGGLKIPGTSMTGPNLQLLGITFLQHLALFGVGWAAHWLLT